MFSIVRLKPHLRLNLDIGKFFNSCNILDFYLKAIFYLKKICFFTISFRLMIDYKSLGIKTAIWCQNY